MSKRIKRFFVTLATAALVLVPLAVPATAFAASPNVEDNLCQGANLTVGAENNCTGTSAQTPVNNLLAAIINGFSIDDCHRFFSSGLRERETRETEADK